MRRRAANHRAVPKRFPEHRDESLDRMSQAVALRRSIAFMDLVSPRFAPVTLRLLVASGRFAPAARCLAVLLAVTLVLFSGPQQSSVADSGYRFGVAEDPLAVGSVAVRVSVDVDDPATVAPTARGAWAAVALSSVPGPHPIVHAGPSSPAASPPDRPPRTA